MHETVTLDLIWWITAVEIPVLGSLFWLIWRVRRDSQECADRNRGDLAVQIQQLREGLAAYKLEVAQSYVSIPYIKEVERRLTDHLVRIETKLDNRKEQA